MSNTPDNASQRLSWLRFSIRNLLAGITVVAIGCVALRNASPLWISMVFTGLFLILAVAILQVVFRRGSERAYWIGFALFGWLYLLLLIFGWNFAPHTYSPLATDNLLSTQLSHQVYHRLYDDAVQGHYAAQAAAMMESGTSSYGGPMGPGGMSNPYRNLSTLPPYPGPDAQQFVSVSHALWVLLLAVCGGWVAKWLYVPNRSVPREEH